MKLNGIEWKALRASASSLADSTDLIAVHRGIAVRLAGRRALTLARRTVQIGALGRLAEFAGEFSPAEASVCFANRKHMLFLGLGPSQSPNEAAISCDGERFGVVAPDGATPQRFRWVRGVLPRGVVHPLLEVVREFYGELPHSLTGGLIDACSALAEPVGWHDGRPVWR